MLALRSLRVSSMDQQAEYPEEPIYEPEEVQEYENATVARPWRVPLANT